MAVKRKKTTQICTTEQYWKLKLIHRRFERRSSLSEYQKTALAANLRASFYKIREIIWQLAYAAYAEHPQHRKTISYRVEDNLRLRRWPWERAREAWESYRHNWCLTALSLVLGCFGAIAAHRWIQPFLRRHPRLSGAAGATLLGRLLIWLATQGILLPRIAVKWLAKLGCIRVFEAESLSPGITSEEAISEAPEAIPAQSLERR